MIKLLVKRYLECRRRTVRRSAKEYFCFVFNNPRTVCRILSMLVVIILSSLSTNYVLNIINATEIKLKKNHFSSPSSQLDVETELLQINTSLNNFDKIIRTFVCHMGFVSIFLFSNILLLKATYKRNLQSINIWLFVHTTHMVYSLSLNVWIGIYKDSFFLISITLFNTILYLLFILLVILFWMNERYFRCVHERAAALRRQRMTL